MNDWVSIESIDKLRASKQIHCDTRDFYIIQNDEPIKWRHTDQPEFWVSRFVAQSPAECKFNRSEILGVLAALKAASGGDGDWRQIGVPAKNLEWLKYIRFIKTDEEVELIGGKEPVYIAYCTDFVIRPVQLSRADLDPDNIKVWLRPDVWSSAH